MENRKEMLLSYVKANIAPILVDFIFGQDLEDSIVLPANIDIKELKSEAIKEFAEKLKEKVKMYNSEGVEEGDVQPLDEAGPERRGRDLAFRGILVPEVWPRPAVGDCGIQL